MTNRCKYCGQFVENADVDIEYCKRHHSKTRCIYCGKFISYYSYGDIVDYEEHSDGTYGETIWFHVECKIKHDKEIKNAH